jgi:hypothetical protein
VPARSETWTVFARSNTGAVGSNPTRDIESVCVYSVFMLFCVLVAALLRADPPSSDLYRLCIGLLNWKSGQGPTTGCTVIDEWIKVKWESEAVTNVKLYSLETLNTVHILKDSQSIQTMSHELNIRGSVSKQITNGIKTAVMDVIGFLCVSLGSSTVQLHDILGSRRACSCSETGFSNQNGDRTRGLYYRRAAFCCAFCGQKNSMLRIFIPSNG